MTKNIKNDDIDSKLNMIWINTFNDYLYFW